MTHLLALWLLLAFVVQVAFPFSLGPRRRRLSDTLSVSSKRDARPVGMTGGLFGESLSPDLTVKSNAGLFGEQAPEKLEQLQANKDIEWQIYVDQSKSSLDRGGSATLDAFCGLAGSVSSEI